MRVAAQEPRRLAASSYVPRPALAADKVRFVGDPGRLRGRADIRAGEGCRGSGGDRHRAAAGGDAGKRGGEAGRAAALRRRAEQHRARLSFWRREKVAAAFAAAAHVVKLPLRNTRLVVERDGAARCDRRITTSHGTAGRCTSCSQGVFGLKNQLRRHARASKPDKVRVLTGNVGGSFGMKAAVYPEYVCILHAARELGRPVKWTDERTGCFVSDHHGRDHEMTAELALDKDGKFLALRLTGYGNLGAYLARSAPLMPTVNAVKNAASVYRTPLIEVSTKCVFTNTTLVSAYRGAGRPEGNYYMERLIDTAAREMGIDRFELRRRNFIKPKEMPFKSSSDMKYDSGDFPAVFKHALEIADSKGFGKRKRDSKKRGKLRGLGVGCFLEVTAPPNKEMGGIRFEDDGTVTIITGTLDYGQGHAAPFAQVLTDKLGVPFDKIRLLQGDSDELLAGGGTGGSRSITASGTAMVQASAKVIDKGKQIAAHVLEASAGDIEFRERPLRHRRHRPRDRHHGACRETAPRHVKLPDGVPPSLNVKPRQRAGARQPSRTAATSPRSRSIPRPASPRS